MKFVQRTVDYKSRNISDKLNIKPVTDYIQNYQRKWNMNRMNIERIPKQILFYEPRDKK
jgi:hypothetical protein